MNWNIKPKTDEGQHLTKIEIELILKLLGTTSFPVKDIEILYNLIIKLQKLHEKG